MPTTALGDRSRSSTYHPAISFLPFFLFSVFFFFKKISLPATTLGAELDD
jgi:hypothetical protein